MSKRRVHEIAKDLGIDSKDLINTLKDFDIPVKNHMSSIKEEDQKIVIEYYNEDETKNESNKVGQNIEPKKEVSTKNTQTTTKTTGKQVKQNTSADEAPNKKQKTSKKHRKEVEVEEKEDVIYIGEEISVKALAEKIECPISEIVKYLMLKGIMATANQEINFDLAVEIGLEYEVLIEKEQEKDFIEEFFAEDDIDDEKDLVKRPPVVVVMGHVDHGKTSLLDAIRKARVTEGEHGGITQHIGAYSVELNNEKITFLDTPGHEAFTAMRLRGAMATDIAILVVAADDGVMPQTVEAINHAKAAGVQIIVAINKIDKEGANPDRVKQELIEYGLVTEDWGGDTICVHVSAIQHTGIDQLLEMILLVAELGELKANPKRAARGTIVEAQLDKGRGPVATVLVQNGTLKIGDSILAGTTHGRVRAMINDQGKRVRTAGPSTPVEILGLSEVPSAGEAFYQTNNEREARQLSERLQSNVREKMIQNTPQKVTLDDLFHQIHEGEMKELKLIVKADVQGSVEAVKQSLMKLSNEEVIINIIHGGVGAINESDVMLASASNAIIIGFNVRPESNAKITADREKIDVRLYRVIYNAIEDIELAMKGMLDPIYEEKVIGHAEVRDTFKVSNVGTIAGSYVTDGKIQRNCQVRLVRDGIVLFEGALASLKRFKDDAKEVATGYECGIMLEKYNDIKTGDVIEAFIMEEIPR
ncbi:translation initiation factor IF-2 [Vallitaleaceae bacterium 9-2]